MNGTGNCPDDKNTPKVNLDGRKKEKKNRISTEVQRSFVLVK